VGKGDPHREREHSWVCEITDRVDLSTWPQGSRLIARRTKLKEGDQQSFADHDGYRLAVFLTDQPGDDLPQLDLTHRGHARIEDRIRQAKDCGLQNLPFRSFAHNQVWLWLVQLAQDLVAWTGQLCLAEQTHAARSQVLNAAYTATPERFVHRAPVPPALPTAAWINKPDNKEAQH
jgi:Transposase DDE domain group 1